MITPRPGFLVVLALLSGCATTPVPQAHHIVRLETCLAAVARIDPGPIDGVIDAQLQAGLQRYYESFVATDLMALGRDPRSAEVEHAAFRALLYRCWREGKLPPGDPLAGMDPASQGPP